MNPVIKYSLARLALFAALATVLLVLPVPLDPMVKLLIALLLSLVLSFFVLKRMRNDMAEYVAGMVERRQEQRAKLQAALAGEDAPVVDTVATEDVPAGTVTEERPH